MKTKLVLGAVAAAVAVFSQGAFAQSASSPTRAEVKAEAKKGALAPAGQGQIASQPSKASDKTRDERKAQTKSDRSSGQLKGAGEAVKPAGEMGSGDKADKSGGSTTDRAARKADAKAATKSGKTSPSESPNPTSDKPMK